MNNLAILNYYNKLGRLFNEIRVSDKKKQAMSLVAGIKSVVRVILKRQKNKKKLIFIGNGASASIASHQATDFWKNGRIRAVAFNDASLLTCVSNDFGYEHVFAKPIEMFADRNDILIAISSSGKSRNILNGVKAALNKQCFVITLSGFSLDNPLYKMGDINFYLPSSCYGHVEVIHLAICHSFIDEIIRIGQGHG